MSTPTTIFLLGATGYIGSQALARLLALPSTHITVLARNPDKIKLIDQFRPGQLVGVQGSLSDLALLEEWAGKVDVVVNCADADDLDATKAILKGQSARKSTTGTPPILIHTSGTGVLADKAAGEYSSPTIFSDLPPRSTLAPGISSIASLPDTALHRGIDLAIQAADVSGDIRSYIILPSTIYGLGTGEIIEKGIGNPQSIQMPAMIKAGLDRGRAGVVGKGANFWPDVHVDDIAELFVKVFELATGGDTENHGESGYFFGESGEHVLLEAGKHIGKAMLQLGLVKPEEEEPTTFSKQDIDKYFGGSPYLGSNSRCHADHSRQIGWAPTHTVEDFYASLEEEVRTCWAGRPEGGWKWGGKL